MNRSLSLRMKLSVFVVFALVFGTAIVALSGRVRTDDTGWLGGGRQDKRIDKAFAVQPGHNLVLRTDVGRVMVVGSESDEVRIRVVSRGSERELQRYDVAFEQDGNTVSVNGKVDRSSFRFFRINNLDVQVDVEVPTSFNLDLRTAGGNLTVRGVNGRVEGQTSGGDVDVERVEGSAKLSTSGGSVSASGIVGDVHLKTSGGNIRCHDLNGSINLRTSGGNITIRDSDGTVRASTSGGDVRVELRDNKGIELATSGGNLIVQLPGSIAGDVRARARGGSVSCEFPFAGKLKESSLRGTINGGGNPIDLSTSGGNITIKSTE